MVQSRNRHSSYYSIHVLSCTKVKKKKNQHLFGAIAIIIFSHTARFSCSYMSIVNSMHPHFLSFSLSLSPSLFANANNMTSFHLQTSFTQAWALYLLATNPDVQERLRSEVQKVVGSEDTVTLDHISKMPFLRDTVKETLRQSLHQLYHFITLKLNNDRSVA